MSKSLAIAFSLCFIALSVSDVEAGIFGRRSRSCRGGNCSHYSTRTYSTYNQPVTYSNRVVSQAPVTVAKPVSQPGDSNAVQSPSDLPTTQSAPAAAPRATYRSRCAGGNCYTTPVYRSPCANGNCYSGSYRSRGWHRR